MPIKALEEEVLERLLNVRAEDEADEEDLLDEEV